MAAFPLPFRGQVSATLGAGQQSVATVLEPSVWPRPQGYNLASEVKLVSPSRKSNSTTQNSKDTRRIAYSRHNSSIFNFNSLWDAQQGDMDPQIAARTDTSMVLCIHTGLSPQMNH